MNFETFLKNYSPNYKQELTEEEIIEIKKVYDQVESIYETNKDKFTEKEKPNQDIRSIIDSLRTKYKNQETK